MERKRILIIDDEPDFVKILKARLQVEGYEVLTAGDGVRGIQVARRERPDLVILDIMMPGMDGHSVCETLKKSSLTEDIPVIYLTARTGPKDETVALEKGAKFYLTKPYNPNVLLEMVKSILTEEEIVGRSLGRVLVIDQDRSSLDEITYQLKKAGYETFAASTTLDGLKEARDQKPDIVLFDFLTSRQDEHHSIQVFNTDEALKAIPLFVLAPQIIVNNLDPARHEVEKFVAKPIHFPSLFKKMARVLGQKG